MMWLKRKIRNWVEQANDKDYGVEKSIGLGIAIEEDYPDADNYTLRVWKANGGRCIQYKRYNRGIDKLHTELYVISDQDDLGEAVKNIVIQQALSGN